MKITDLQSFKEHPAYLYAEKIISNETPANELIKIVAQDFIDELEKGERGESDYFFDYNLVNGIDDILQLVIVPSGFAAGKPAGDVLAGFQWFFILNALAWKMADNHEKRRYEKSVLLIARKSGKTFVTGILFILLMLLEPAYSNFFSVAPTLDLSKLIFTEVKNQLNNSPYLAKRFNVTNSYIECLINHNKFTPLATGKQTMDGRLANVYVADEVGALRDSYPIQAMESSQMNIINRTGILISTAYPSLSNPMTDQVDRIEKYLLKKKNGEEQSGNSQEKVFGLIYKPDNPSEWKTSDDELLKANPLAIENTDSLEVLKKKRRDAIESETERSNFLTKHMNIFINGAINDTFVTSEEMEGIEVPVGSIDWVDKEVYVGLDLSQSNDNTAVAITHYDKDEDIMYGKTWIFYPEMREDEKQKVEGINYARASEEGLSIPSGDMVIDYDQIEQFVLDLERNFGVIVKGVGYDPWNAPAMAVRLSKEYDVYKITQGDSGVYPATKWLKEKILKKEFHFEENNLLMANFLNAKKKTSDTMSYHLNKKQSDGKIDAVAALVDSIALWDAELVEESNSTSELFII